MRLPSYRKKSSTGNPLKGNLLFLLLPQKRRLKTIATVGILCASLIGCEKKPNLFGTEPKNNEESALKNAEKKEDVKQLPPKKIEKGAVVVRRPLQTSQVGIWGIDLLLDKEKINKVNQRRDNSKINDRPDLFGVDGDFRPLFIIHTNKKGILEIKGETLGEIQIETAEVPERLEIYPEFDLEKLFEDTGDQTETIEIVFIEGEARSLVEKIRLNYSKSNEIYAEDPNLSDIASLSKEMDEELASDTKNKSTLSQIKDANTLLKAALSGLDKHQIEYEPLGVRTGFKKIRNPREMREAKRANDLELCLWLASLMSQSNLEPILIVTESKVLLGVQEKGLESGSTVMTYLDPEKLLNRDYGEKSGLPPDELIKWRIDKSMISGNHEVKQNFEQSPNKIFALELNEWENMFRSED